MKNEKELLNKMSVEHNYYCEISELWEEWKNIAQFLIEFEDSDIDYNLVFRWDINIEENEIRIHMMHQRKGRFFTHVITNIDEKNLPRLCEYLKRHWKYLHGIWSPISNYID